MGHGFEAHPSNMPVDLFSAELWKVLSTCMENFPHIGVGVKSNSLYHLCYRIVFDLAIFLPLLPVPKYPPKTIRSAVSAIAPSAR